MHFIVKFCHPISTLDGRRRVERPKKVLISVLSSSLLPFTGAIGSSLLNKPLFLQKLSRTSLNQSSYVFACPCQTGTVKPGFLLQYWMDLLREEVQIER